MYRYRTLIVYSDAKYVIVRRFIQDDIDGRNGNAL